MPGEFKLLGIIKKVTPPITYIEYIYKDDFQNRVSCIWYRIGNIKNMREHIGRIYNYNLVMKEPYSIIDLYDEDIFLRIETHEHHSPNIYLNTIDCIHNEKYMYNPHVLSHTDFPLQYRKRYQFYEASINNWLADLYNKSEKKRWCDSTPYYKAVVNGNPNELADLCISMKKSAVFIPQGTIDDFMEFFNEILLPCPVNQLDYISECPKCRHKDCLRGGCTGQYVTPTLAVEMHTRDTTWKTMYEQVKYSFKVDRWRLWGVVEKNDARARYYRYMLALWEEVFLPPKKQ